MGSPPNEQGSSSTSSSSTATVMRRNQEDIDEPLIQYLFRRTVGGGGGGSGPTAPSATQPSRLRVSPVETVFGGGSGDGTGNRSDSPIDLERVTIPAPLFPPQSSSLYQRNVESNDHGSGHDSSPYRVLLSGFNNRRREHGRRDYEVNKTYNITD